MVTINKDSFSLDNKILVEFEDIRGPSSKYRIQAEWDGASWRFYERDSWEARWYLVSKENKKRYLTRYFMPNKREIFRRISVR